MRKKYMPGSVILTLLILYCNVHIVVPVVGENESACKELGAFYCADGSCISSEEYCDGRIDCIDGSDEDFCPGHTPDVECDESRFFVCKNKNMCIPKYWQCNSVKDCDDGSDEKGCTDSELRQSPLLPCNKGFLCDGSRCISKYWVCDGTYDCKDQSDEDMSSVCKHAFGRRKANTVLDCRFFDIKCSDGSFCILDEQRCDGMRDCRDGSDEGPFCESWSSMCDNVECGNRGDCEPTNEGPVCSCGLSQIFNETKQACVQIGCSSNQPVCSHQCKPSDRAFRCTCDPGYDTDLAEYLCFAPGEAQLFFSTRNDIRYLNVKSRRMVFITDAVKKAHGITFDGTYVYWVESAAGHQSISRANFTNVAGTRQVVVALGVEEPGDVAVDHYAGNIYFGDTQRHAIFVCKMNGSMCMTLEVGARSPKFITLHHRKGQMYWSDWHTKPVILMANMDGTKPENLVEDLTTYPTGLALDAPNDRLYFVDKIIRVVRLDTKEVYTFFVEPFLHPYALTTFENAVYWSDWTTNTIKSLDKIHYGKLGPSPVLQLDVPVYDLHMYHPLLMTEINNQCSKVKQNCSHFCLLSGGTSYTCACPEGMQLKGEECQPIPAYRPRYLIVGAGTTFTRIQYNVMSSPDLEKYELHSGRIQALAYDSIRDILYYFDGSEKSINYLPMSTFMHTSPSVLLYDDIDNIIDMDFDFVSDTLYVADSTRHVVEAISVRNQMKAFVTFFKKNEVPLSICVIPEYGMLLVAIMNEDNEFLYVDSMGLDGSQRKRFPIYDLMGPYIHLRYSPEMDMVYISDDGRQVIEQIHPLALRAMGTTRKVFRRVGTTLANIAATGSYVFWSDRRTSRLYWADPHDFSAKIRRIELSTRLHLAYLHLVAAVPPPDIAPYKLHKCFHQPTPCSHMCVQQFHDSRAPKGFGYQCLCPKGLLLEGNKCVQKIKCSQQEMYCHKSNACVSKNKMCDGVKNCKFGEDEDGCVVPSASSRVKCPMNQMNCYGECLQNNAPCIHPTFKCNPNEYQCGNRTICLERAMVCDGHIDCPDGSDEIDDICDNFKCQEKEFTCKKDGSCIPQPLRCDGSIDCRDGTDEHECDLSVCGSHGFQCFNGQCIDAKLHCDNKADCEDRSDEQYCDLPNPAHDLVPSAMCPSGKMPCKNNKTICIIPTQRCNGKVDCPGGTDETDCTFRCEPNGFSCIHEIKCVHRLDTCDGTRDCLDGSDETYPACVKTGRTSSPFAKLYENGEECSFGYRCANGHCIDWSQVCDSYINCHDGSDENGLCNITCDPKKCDHICHPTPRGNQCMCHKGYELVNDICVDIDECAHSSCSHLCENTIGSYKCSCHKGFTLRADGRSCRVEVGELSIMYVSNHAVWSVTPTQDPEVVYEDPHMNNISDISYNYQKDELYISSSEGKSLVRLTVKKHEVHTITHVGAPTKMAVDWITDNVYFLDVTLYENKIRVCHFDTKRCAVLGTFINGTKARCIAVDPYHRRLFYHRRGPLGPRLVSADLSCHYGQTISTVYVCSGLAIDTFTKNLYLARDNLHIIYRIGYQGETFVNAITNARYAQDPELYEDHVYYTNSTDLIRCALFGNKTCEVFAPIATESFVIYHAITQRTDVENQCDRFDCSNICVLGDDGPMCICPHGNLTYDGICDDVDEKELAMFDYQRHQLQPIDNIMYNSVRWAVVVVLVIAVGIAILYAIYKYKKRNRVLSDDFSGVNPRPEQIHTPEAVHHEPILLEVDRSRPPQQCHHITSAPLTVNDGTHVTDPLPPSEAHTKSNGSNLSSLAYKKAGDAGRTKPEHRRRITLRVRYDAPLSSAHVMEEDAGPSARIQGRRFTFTNIVGSLRNLCRNPFRRAPRTPSLIELQEVETLPMVVTEQNIPATTTHDLLDTSIHGSMQNIAQAIKPEDTPIYGHQLSTSEPTTVASTPVTTPSHECKSVASSAASLSETESELDSREKSKLVKK